MNALTRHLVLLAGVVAVALAVVACSSGQAPAPTAAPAKPAAAEPTKAPAAAAPAAPTAAPAAAAPTAAPKVDYPTKTVTYIAPSVPGSGYDTTARAMAAVIEKEKLLPVALPVMNASSVPEGMATIVQQHKNDPYMIAIQSTAILMNKAVGSSPYGYQDTTPIANLIATNYGFVVTADSPYKTLKDALDDLKNNPDKTPLTGGRTDDRTAYGVALAGYGIDPTKINYAAFGSATEAAATLLEGSAKVEISTVDDLMGLIQAKKLRVLATSGPKRMSGILADVPTFKEAGLNVEWTNFRYIAGGPNMPDYAVQYWKDLATKMIKTPSWKDAVAKYSWIEQFQTDGLDQFLAEKYKLIDTAAGQLGMKQH